MKLETNTEMPTDSYMRRRAMVESAAALVGALPDQTIPGLWHVPGYPELTTGQLLQIAAERSFQP